MGGDTATKEDNEIGKESPAVVITPIGGTKTKLWVNDTSFTTLTELISGQLKQDQLNTESSSPPPTVNIDQDSPHQHLRINGMRHRGVVSDLTTLELFKSFVVTLRKADTNLVLLPYEASKKHYTSLSNQKQLDSIDANRMHQYFCSYYQRQNYSLSGYLHLRSALSFKELVNSPPVQEWLDANRYILKLCPSQVEEMVQIGALCYSHMLMNREVLKAAIIKHDLWKPDDDTDPPIFDLYLSNFIADQKKTKMLFVSSEKSKRTQVIKLFKTIYDSSPKEYPNGSTMVFILLTEGTHTSPAY
jgi:hypothetical protein